MGCESASLRGSMLASSPSGKISSKPTPAKRKPAAPGRSLRRAAFAWLTGGAGRGRDRRSPCLGETRKTAVFSDFLDAIAGTSAGVLNRYLVQNVDKLGKSIVDCCQRAGFQ
jgi:hypothetical protein